MTTISDERLAEIVADKDNFYRDEIKSMAHELQSLRAQGGVRVEEDGGTERYIDELWLRALNTNADADMLTYFSACSKWFQDRHFRRMTLSSLEASPAPVLDERGGYWSDDKTYEQASPAPVSEHPDDMAVDRFAAAMKAKLAKKREEGRGGWEDKDECSTAFLSGLLREHVEKGDPLDVGNLAMMLHQRGDAIAPAPVSEEMVRASDVSGPVPADHPLMVAWTAYVSTDEYANTFRWAQHEEHRRGSLWAAFDQGYRAALAAKGGQ